MTLKFPRELTIGATDWVINPYRFNTRELNGSSEPTYRDVTISGVSPLVLPNAEANGLKSIKLFGSCKQTSRNLFDKDKVKDNYYLNSSGNEVSSTSWCISDFIEVSPSNQYIMSGTTSYGNNPKKCYYNESKTFISSDSQNDEPFYPVANAKYIKISVYKSSLSTFQFEQGSSATSYTPFVPTPTLTDRIDIICNNGIVGRSSGGITETVSMNTQTSTAQDLLSCGDDYVDVQNITTGEITRNVGIIIFDGSENWTKPASQPSDGICFQYNGLTNRAYGSGVLGSCTNFKTVVDSASQQDIGIMRFARTTRIIFVYVDDTQFPTEDDWEAYLATQYTLGKPLIVVYPLATSTTESVTAQTNIQTVEGTNTLTITQSALEGLQLEVTYSAGVEVTVETVEEANPDQTVEVVIGD